MISTIIIMLAGVVLSIMFGVISVISTGLINFFPQVQVALNTLAPIWSSFSTFLPVVDFLNVVVIIAGIEVFILSFHLINFAYKKVFHSG